MAKRVLVVDDEQNIVDILRFNLEREGYEVITAEDGIQGLAMARSSDPDLILLDVMMPEMDGFQVCRELRREDKLTPIIMLTAREEEADRVMGLELGADDYVSKPFSVRELMARVRTNIRRQTAMNEPDAGRKEGMIQAGSITVDTVGLQIFKNGVPVEVTQREYALLLFLAGSVGTVFSREIMMQ